MTIADGLTGSASDFVSTSAGAGDSGKVPKLNASGGLDKSFTGIDVETTTGATHSLTTVANQRVVVWVKGDYAGVSAANTITLFYNGVQKDIVAINPDDTSRKSVFSLMYTETPGAATHNITVVGSGSTAIANVVIIVLKLPA